MNGPYKRAYAAPRGGPWRRASAWLWSSEDYDGDGIKQTFLFVLVAAVVIVAGASVGAVNPALGWLVSAVLGVVALAMLIGPIMTGNVIIVRHKSGWRDGINPRPFNDVLALLERLRSLDGVLDYERKHIIRIAEGALWRAARAAAKGGDVRWFTAQAEDLLDAGERILEVAAQPETDDLKMIMEQIDARNAALNELRAIQGKDDH